ncbi:MAG: hypothetical protein IJ570_03695 [Prevotella sp.]|nr:hypothetical protein [Prevotella sp.]
MTSEVFSRLIISDDVVNRIKQYRANLPALDQNRKELKTLQGYLADPATYEGILTEDELKAEVKRIQHEIRTLSAIKTGLPTFTYQAVFDETVSKKGYKGRWRKQAAARLNGLFILDVDHVNPKLTLNRWLQDYAKTVKVEALDTLTPEKPLFTLDECRELIRPFCKNLGILLMHVTPSGCGLRIVAKADPTVGNLADNQANLSRLLGVEPDEACKDASRCSFCPGFEDILYMNSEELFTYENPQYDEMFGPQYRGCSSQPTKRPVAGAANHSAGAAVGHGDGAAQGGGAAGESASKEPEDGDGYRGVSYEKIIDQWFRETGGEPAQGERHYKLLRLATNLRYICDNNAASLLRALRKHRVGEAYYMDDAADLTSIADSVCQKQLWPGLPKRFKQVLENAGVQLYGEGGDAAAEAAAATDYEGYAQRLQPLLGDSPGLREAVADLPDRLKLGGVLCATAMLGTYLTRTWWEHFDGRLYRLSFLTYIVGAAASGKSFLTDLDRLLMAPLQSADRVGRAAEQQYKEAQRRRKASEKLPEQPHPVIRYCPSSTSNAILYRRLQDAIDKDVTDPTTGEPLHLHLITVESELATALRAQVGNWAGKNDLELKSFHNELAGVDYANADSTNGIMQVNWNQVVSGTQESMSRKIKPQTVLDGMVTRLSLFLMPSNDYQMLERRRYVRNHERECMLRQLGYQLEAVKGELRAPRLVQFCYEYEEELTRRARLEQDRCLDYFRKRIPVIMMRHALVRMVLRQIDALAKGEDLVERDDDLEYARLIGDWCLEMQITMFGQMVMDALEKEAANFTPRRMHTKTRSAYNQLPEQFTANDLVGADVAANLNAAKVTLYRWEQDGLIERTNDGKFIKKIKTV